MITILDYGMGNLRSVEKAIEKLGGAVNVSSTLPSEGKLIIPGVGAFGAAMERLSGLRTEIQSRAKSGMPILGICLGQQLLFESSEEHGFNQGLGLLPGTVKYFAKDSGLKVPLIGWMPLTPVAGKQILAGIQPEEQVYFVHSLYTDCADPADIAATTTYGITFAAAVQRGNVYGCQFHPEKSSQVGLRILRNFIEC